MEAYLTGSGVKEEHRRSADNSRSSGGASFANIKFENHAVNTSGENQIADSQPYKIAPKFKYSINPYDHEILETKQSQVNLELA